MTQGAELKRWGYPCAGETSCKPECGPASFGGHDFDICPGSAARSSWRLQAALIKRREGQICQRLDPSSLPAWLLEDLSLIEQEVTEQASRRKK